MKTALCLGLWVVLCGLRASADESEREDSEREAVLLGALGTVNVLRELEPGSFINRVSVTSNVTAPDSKPEDTIDGGGKCFKPKLDQASPLVLTYALPGLRTVSSLAIAYEDARSDGPDLIRLEGSSDGGNTWSELFKRKARRSEFVKCFKPATVNRLRLTQAGGGARRTKEVSIYADPDIPLPLHGGAGLGAFNFLRDLWYGDRIKLFGSPDSDVWTKPYGGKSFPHVPFDSRITTTHDGAWGGSEKNEVGRRVYLRLDLDKAYPMNFGVIGSPSAGDPRGVLAGASQAEFYTSDGALDPGALKGGTPKDLTAQGWILQKSWDKDPSLCKSFALTKPGRYRQMLLVWDGLGFHPSSPAWSRLELFGFDPSAK
jgi:hypothetical protein